MSYPRTAAQRINDLSVGHAVEDVVVQALGPNIINHTNSTDKLDIWIPGGYVEVKAKNQPLSTKWTKHCPEDWDERDCFVLDELSVRKALEHYPHACLVLYDRPCDRWFMAPIDVLAVSDRVRLNRTGPTGIVKGKWIINVTGYQPIKNMKKLAAMLAEDRIKLRWKESACLGVNVKDVK